MDKTKKELQKRLNRCKRINKQMEDRSKVKYLRKMKRKISTLEKEIDEQGKIITDLREHIKKLEHELSILE